MPDRPSSSGNTRNASGEGPGQRLFLAFNLPPRAAEHLESLAASWAADYRKGRGGSGKNGADYSAISVALVPRQNLHITLHFLGNVDAAMEAELRNGLRRIVTDFAPLSFDTGRVLCFPGPRDPRILALECLPGEGGKARELALSSARLLADLGIPVDRRPWRPHVTLARFRAENEAGRLLRNGKERSAADAAGREDRPGARNAFPKSVSFRAASLDLMLSLLSPAGARYEVVERFPFGGGKIPAQSDDP